MTSWNFKKHLYNVGHLLFCAIVTKLLEHPKHQTHIIPGFLRRELTTILLSVKIRSIMYVKASHHVTSDFQLDVRTLHLSNAMPINKIALSWKTSISNGVRTGALHFSASCCWRMEPLGALSVNCFPESIRCWQWQQAPAQNANQQV